MGVDINWGITQQQPNLAGGFLQSYEAGKNMGMQQKRQNALAAWSQNPDDPAATNALLAADPATGIQLINARKAQADIQRAADARHMLSLALGGQGGAPAAGMQPTAPNAMTAQPGAPTAPGEAPQGDEMTITAQRPKPSVGDIAALDPAMAEKLVTMTSQMDDAGRKRVTDQQDALGSVATQIAQLPPEKRRDALDSATPFLLQHGITPKQIEDFDPTDENLHSVISMAAGTKAIVSQQTAERGQDMSAKTAAAGQAVTMRGQNIDHADKVADRKAKAAEAGGGLDPQSIDFYADKVAQGGDLPQLGMGKAAARTRQMILARAAQMQRGQGMDGGDSNALHASVKADVQGLATLQKRATIVNSAEGAAVKNADLAVSLGKQNGNGQIPLFNAWRNLGGRATGDPAISKFNASVETFANEYSSVMGKGVPTDSLRAHAHDMIHTAQSPQQFEGVIKVLKADMANVKTGLEDERQSTLTRLKGHGSKPANAGPPVMTPQQVQAAPAGTLFTTNDGRVMRKR